MEGLGLRLDLLTVERELKELREAWRDDVDRFRALLKLSLDLIPTGQPWEVVSLRDAVDTRRMILSELERPSTPAEERLARFLLTLGSLRLRGKT